jgi:diguanylate cyclase (GGDEF)-like protein
MLLLILSSYLFFAKDILLDVSFSILGLWSITIIHVLYNNASAFVENMRLKNQLSFDALTNVYSYQYFELLVKTKLSRLSAEQRIVLVVFDLDNFKQINDTYGHAVGNEVLETFAALLKKHARKDDQIARFGGDEFCALLDSGENGAYHFLNRVSEDLVALNQQKSGLPKFTFSAGGAVARGKFSLTLNLFFQKQTRFYTNVKMKAAISLKSEVCKSNFFAIWSGIRESPPSHRSGRAPGADLFPCSHEVATLVEIHARLLPSIPTLFAFHSKSGIRESNPCHKLGKLAYYHYTNPAFKEVITLI